MDARVRVLVFWVPAAFLVAIAAAVALTPHVAWSPLVYLAGTLCAGWGSCLASASSKLTAREHAFATAIVVVLAMPWAVAAAIAVGGAAWSLLG